MKIIQWGIYTLPDGVQVQAIQSAIHDRWRFDTLDGQPLLLENDQRRGQLLQMTLDHEADCYRLAPCDMTIEDLSACEVM